MKRNNVRTSHIIPMNSLLLFYTFFYYFAYKRMSTEPAFNINLCILMLSSNYDNNII